MSKMNKLDRIKEMSDQYDNNGPSERRERLRTLVDTHGYDAVSAATGLNVSTIQVYMRHKDHTMTIRDSKLQKAEKILAQLK